MSDDICDRLVRFSAHKQCMSTDLEVEAADEITRLRAENEKLRAALKPFVKTLEWNCTDADPDDACIDHEGALSIGDLRAAAAAIREGGKDGKI